MKRVALIGSPVEHSLSPAIQAAAFAEHGLDWSYDLIDLKAADLPAMLARLRGPQWAGANVTLPHKVAVIEDLDHLDATARDAGAVNTIVNRDGSLHGFNTDVTGFARDVERLGLQVRNRATLLLGAGGAARAVALALARQGAALTVAARSRRRAERWVRPLRQAEGVEIEIRSWERLTFAECPSDALIVNATPIGMWPQAAESPWPEKVQLPASGAIYDLVYRPPETELVRRGRNAGLAAQGGLGMLVEQACLAFQHWTGLPAPRGAMRTAALTELEVA